jgi:hypothetical protein
MAPERTLGRIWQETFGICLAVSVVIFFVGTPHIQLVSWLATLTIPAAVTWGTFLAGFTGGQGVAAEGGPGRGSCSASSAPVFC